MPQGRWPVHVKLTHAIRAVISRGRHAHPALRRLVFAIARYGDAAGISRDDVCRALVDFIRDHPLCSRLDRVSLADGQHVSDQLIAQVERWIAAA
jgi:hypothetical protein